MPRIVREAFIDLDANNCGLIATHVASKAGWSLNPFEESIPYISMSWLVSGVARRDIVVGWYCEELEGLKTRVLINVTLPGLFVRDPEKNLDRIGDFLVSEITKFSDGVIEDMANGPTAEEIIRGEADWENLFS